MQTHIRLFFSVWSLEFGVWSFGREEKIQSKKAFVPDCITMAIVLVFLNKS